MNMQSTKIAPQSSNWGFGYNIFGVLYIYKITAICNPLVDEASPRRPPRREELIYCSHADQTGWERRAEALTVIATILFTAAPQLSSRCWVNTEIF